MITISTVEVKGDFKVSADLKSWITLANFRSNSSKNEMQPLFLELKVDAQFKKGLSSIWKKCKILVLHPDILLGAKSVILLQQLIRKKMPTISV